MWPFEGREAERETIRSAYAGSDVDTVLITGAPAGRNLGGPHRAPGRAEARLRGDDRPAWRTGGRRRAADDQGLAIGACMAQLAGGHPLKAHEIAAAGLEMASQGGAAVMMLPGWALFGGMAALARGRAAEAHGLLDEAHAGFAVNDTFRLAHCCQVARAAAAALRCDPDAGLFLAQADGRVQPSNRIFLPWIQTWRAWCAYARGDLPSASHNAAVAADLAREAQMPAVEALAFYDIARLGGRPRRPISARPSPRCVRRCSSRRTSSAS